MFPQGCMTTGLGAKTQVFAPVFIDIIFKIWYFALLMKKLLLKIAAATIGLWLATVLVPGISVRLLSDSNFFGLHISATWQMFLILGIVLGLLNYFIKPILDTITFPLRIITLGIFSIVTMMATIWIESMAFRELSVPLWLPLLWTAVIIWMVNFGTKFIIKD